METTTAMRMDNERESGALLPSWRLMLSLLVGVPCAVPLPVASEGRTRTHRIDALSPERD
jgi:hypothetical protein